MKEISTFHSRLMFIQSMFESKHDESNITSACMCRGMKKLLLQKNSSLDYDWRYMIKNIHKHLNKTQNPFLELLQKKT